MLMRRHDGSQVKSTSLLLSSVSASSLPDGDVLKARTRSLPDSSAVPLAEKKISCLFRYFLFLYTSNVTVSALEICISKEQRKK